MPDSSLVQLLAYPSQDARLIQQRRWEAASLGILSILGQGNKKIRGVPVLGKGYCGVVLLCQGDWGQGQKTAALKVRRTDISKGSFEFEAKGLAIANSQDVGPKLYTHSQNFIVMEYLDGPSLLQWLNQPHTPDVVNNVILDLLEQCFRLDQLGLDHGNVRCVTEHVILQGSQPILIDFSSSSCDRRPANVTTLTQGLFWGTKIPFLVQRFRPLPDRDQSIRALRQYKHHPHRDNFEKLITRLMNV